MKVIICIIISFLINISGIRSQNFEAYQKIIDPEFKAFVDLFHKKDLPIDTEWLVANQPWILKKSREVNIPEIPEDLLAKFLMEPGDGKFIFPIFRTGDEAGNEIKVYGDFYPVFKLPTNGDYVILVIAQLSNVSLGENEVYAYSFDLNGNFISGINSLYSADSWIINNKISNDLTTTSKGAFRYKNDVKMTADPYTPEAIIETDIHKINSDGAITKLSSEQKNAKIKYVESEKRLKVIEYLD